MSKILTVSGTEEWRRLLAAEYHWKPGYSACTISNCWLEAEGFPPEICNSLNESADPLLTNVQPLIAVPEFKVPLPGGKRASQNDLFVLARSSAGLITIMVEGKVAESFGPTLNEWNNENKKQNENQSKKKSGKPKRLAFLLDSLGLPENISDKIRYQLLHRAASALIAGEQFHAKAGILLVHAFSKDNEKSPGWNDYEAFVHLFGVTAAPGIVQRLSGQTNIPLFAVWVNGNPRFLDSGKQN